MRQRHSWLAVKTLWFLALVAERPPKVAVGFHPRSAIPPNHLVAERRWNHRHAIGRPRDACRRLPTSPRRTLRASSLRRSGWVETHGDRNAGSALIESLKSRQTECRNHP